MLKKTEILELISAMAEDYEKRKTVQNRWIVQNKFLMDVSKNNLRVRIRFL
jgi:hypothetical protein